ncbi:MAG: tRNA (N6-threonylcarbamoyladenosine(37)-N6)-methyltransferase TrmO [Cellulosilyticum sp.]|nr:tRNA (N6-threonylcarbamoyladenosine(37)-N6)-methyltransferase TrmO [Cellulosilyticum sp.]
MGEIFKIRKIAQIRSDFPSKFGIPRQSGLADELRATIIFEPEYRDANAVRGLDEFSHIWLIWQFSKAVGKKWSPTVKPPRLGGNTRMGVFATRSPFRPNNLGLSCVKLEKIEYSQTLGPVLTVVGADLLDGTPIYDIKPYLPYVDSHPEALGGFAQKNSDYGLEVVFPEEWLSLVPEEKRHALIQVLAQDPRPSYQIDPTRIYGMEFAELEVKFTVQEQILTVCKVEKRMMEK